MWLWKLDMDIINFILRWTRWKWDMVEIQDAAVTQIVIAAVEIMETMEIMVSLEESEIVVEDIYSY